MATRGLLLLLGLIKLSYGSLEHNNTIFDLTSTASHPKTIPDESHNAKTSGHYNRYFTVSNKEQAYVNAGSLVSLGGELQAQEKADLLDSLLFAELTASDMYDKTRDFSAWYDIYISALYKNGWDIKTLKFRPVDALPGSTYTLLGKVLELLGPFCKGVQTTILKKLLDVWEHLQDYDKRVRCFLSSSGKGTVETDAANFRIMPAIRGNTGEVFIVFGGFYYNSNQAVGRYMTYNWPASSISLQYSVAVSKFRSSDYAMMRRAIQRALGDRANLLIHEIDLD